VHRQSFASHYTGESRGRHLRRCRGFDIFIAVSHRTRCIARMIHANIRQLQPHFSISSRRKANSRNYRRKVMACLGGTQFISVMFDTYGTMPVGRQLLRDMPTLALLSLHPQRMKYLLTTPIFYLGADTSRDRKRRRSHYGADQLLGARCLV
jgi:hypothetical protein